MKELTAQKLIRYSMEQIQKADRYNQGGTAGKEPYYPILVVFLGNDAVEGSESISSGLFRMWPQYKQELKFIGVEKESQLQYSSMEFREGKLQKNKLTPEKVRDVVGSLFGAMNHFQDKGKLLVYYITDTTGIKDIEEYIGWMSALEQTRELLEIDRLDMLDMQIVLLNEKPAKRKIGRKIRNFICEKENRKCATTYLIGNRRSDNAILEDWESCYNIVADIISLSDNSDTRVTEAMFYKTILTVSYAKEEKPMEQIGQIVVSELLDRLSVDESGQQKSLMEDEQLLNRLNVSKDGCFGILDGYVESVLVPLLPTREQLELFPRRNPDNQIMAFLSAKQFDKETMGAWENYLAMIADQAQEKVTMDSGMRKRWREEYSRMLCKNFTAEELIYLKDHMGDLKERLGQHSEPSKELSVLDHAKSSLKYLLSSEAKVVDFFLEVISEQGRKAEEFLEKWRSLLQSRNNVFVVKNEDVNAFYGHKMTDYYDRYGHNIKNEFKKIKDTKELEAFLYKHISKVIDSDQVFADSFEVELEKRIKAADTEAKDSKNYIRQRLTGKKVYTYLQANFAYGEPIFSSMLLKAGTALYKYLKENLDSNTYYYDTGSGNGAEALNVYEVTYENLINDEGR